MNTVVEKLGTYVPLGAYEVLKEMQIFSYGILMIGLIFDIMLIMFVMISVLLIYSLLMINIETKTFEIGVMRLAGLSKGGFVAMIFVQSVMFVLPSLIAALICVVPALWAIFSKLQGGKVPFNADVLPSWVSLMEGLFVGLVIPAISAIIPIKRALSKTLTESLNVARSQTSGVVY